MALVAPLGAAPARAQEAATTAYSEDQQQQQAREAFERGRIHYGNGEFPQAAAAFEEAYRLSGREGLLYNLYLAYRDSSEPEKAAEALRAYLAKVEVIENRAQLEARLKSLDDDLARRKAAEQASIAEQERQRSAAQRAQQEAAAAKAHTGKWWVMPVSVMGGGGALMLGSVATGVMALHKSKDLADHCQGNDCAPQYRSTADSGKTLAVVTDVLLFTGVATTAVGAMLLFLKRPKHQEEQDRRPQANLACSRVGCAGSVTLRF